MPGRLLQSPRALTSSPVHPRVSLLLWRLPEPRGSGRVRFPRYVIHRSLRRRVAHLSLSMAPYRLASSVPARLEAIELVDSELSGDDEDMKVEESLRRTGISLVFPINKFL